MLLTSYSKKFSSRLIGLFNKNTNAMNTILSNGKLTKENRLVLSRHNKDNKTLFHFLIAHCAIILYNKEYN